MVIQVLGQNNFVNEALVPRPVVFFQRIGEPKVERKVRVLVGEILEEICMEDFLL